MCDTRLGDSTGLLCDNPDPHEPHKGCTFKASSLGDRHEQADSDARQDNERGQR